MDNFTTLDHISRLEKALADTEAMWREQKQRADTLQARFNAEVNKRAIIGDDNPHHN